MIALSKTQEEPFVFISSGNFLQPITTSFILENTGDTKRKQLSVYLITEDELYEDVRVKVIGERPGIDIQLSLDGENWYNELRLGDKDGRYGRLIDEIFIRFSLLDDFSVLDPSEIGSVINFIKIAVTFAA